MSVNPTYLFSLSRIQVESLIKAVSASDHYHKNYNSSHKTNLISDIDLQFVLDDNDTLRNILKTSLCPRPSETVSTVVEGISYIQSLRNIQAQLSDLSEKAFHASIITDDEAYLLLSIDQDIQSLIEFDRVVMS